jgi:hypothetical protein
MGIFGKKKKEFELEFRTPEGACYFSIKGPSAYGSYEVLMSDKNLIRRTKTLSSGEQFEIFEAAEFTGFRINTSLSVYIPKGAYVKILV